MPEVLLNSGEVIKAAGVEFNQRPWVGITIFPNFDGYIPQSSEEYERKVISYHEDKIERILWGVAEI